MDANVVPSQVQRRRALHDDRAGERSAPVGPLCRRQAGHLAERQEQFRVSVGRRTRRRHGHQDTCRLRTERQVIPRRDLVDDVEVVELPLADVHPARLNGPWPPLHTGACIRTIKSCGLLNQRTIQTCLQMACYGTSEPSVTLAEAIGRAEPLALTAVIWANRSRASTRRQWF